MNEAANDSARVSGQDRKKLPALGTNQIAGFGGFRPLASLEKDKYIYFFVSNWLSDYYFKCFYIRSLTTTIYICFVFPAQGKIYRPAKYIRVSCHWQLSLLSINIENIKQQFLKMILYLLICKSFFVQSQKPSVYLSFLNSDIESN